MTSLAHLDITAGGAIAEIVLDDPDRRNALGLEMLDALETALGDVPSDAIVVLLRAQGPAFCAGFDMGAAAAAPGLLVEFIERLGGLTRALRRHPAIIVAAVHGAAIAGGCAIVSACDLVVVGPSATLGYPVHPLGISPAVTLATLETSMHPGAARSLLLEGRLLSGTDAHRLQLASHLATTDDAVLSEARALARQLDGKGHHALRVTKAWLNELDGSLDDTRFDGPRVDSAGASQDEESIELLRAFWARRQARRRS